VLVAVARLGTEGDLAVRARRALSAVL